MTKAAKILAMDTSTSACSVALRVDGIVHTLYEEGNNIHSQRLLSMCQTLLREAGWRAAALDAVAVGHGPGSFTGLRIGVGVAQGLAYGAGCPMIGVSSLQALACQLPEHGTVLAGIDARMGQIYWARFDKRVDSCALVGEEQVSDPAHIHGVEGAWLVGNAWQEYLDQLAPELLSGATHMKSILYPRAEQILELAEDKFARGEVIKAAEFVPHYVRNEVAKKSG
ncbi:MAG: tRNA (adenosine(37)-N6)-threonylcarbamoyltransferase complex dimerization subunit type 1 TsaB [Gammaproteobacteria bacterium]|nr:tRNA (adenosine(37)-N6)-threonylcarbamoyltransferase complex dimerization subunit type 1 TsaB [Gammaproteobacteria bacterium]